MSCSQTEGTGCVPLVPLTGLGVGATESRGTMQASLLSLLGTPSLSLGAPRVSGTGLRSLAAQEGKVTLQSCQRRMGPQPPQTCRKAGPGLHLYAEAPMSLSLGSREDIHVPGHQDNTDAVSAVLGTFGHPLSLVSRCLSKRHRPLGQDGDSYRGDCPGIAGPISWAKGCGLFGAICLAWPFGRPHDSPERSHARAPGR